MAVEVILEFIGFLKKKGTGPTMSKSLVPEELDRITVLLADESIPMITKATLVTAIMVLEKTPAEQAWIDGVSANPLLIPEPIRWLVTAQTDDLLNQTILRIISGDELSESEAARWMESLFDDETPGESKAAFLEALRLRRETEIENKAALAACLSRASFVTVDLPLVVDISNAYDGYNRNLFLSPFVASVLAALGVPVVLHGMDEVSPKRGVNTRKILEFAGKSGVRSLAQIEADITTIGWAYVDQSVACPALYSLKELRVQMVKRPILATVEKLLLPVRAQKTVMVTGYTHPPYKGKTVMLLNQLPLSAGVIVRGLEGSTQMPLDRRAPEIRVAQDRSVHDDFVRPEDLGVATYETVTAWDGVTVADCVAQGIAALQCTPGETLDLIRYQSAQILRAFDLLDDPLVRVDEVIQSGAAFAKWDAF